MQFQDNHDDFLKEKPPFKFQISQNLHKHISIPIRNKHNMTKLSFFVIQISFWNLHKLMDFRLRKFHLLTSNVQISYKKMVYCDRVLYITFKRPKNRNFAMRLSASLV